MARKRPFKFTLEIPYDRCLELEREGKMDKFFTHLAKALKIISGSKGIRITKEPTDAA